MATSVPPDGTSKVFAQVTNPDAFPPGVRQWQINGSTEEETLGCVIDSQTGEITVGKTSGKITVRVYCTDTPDCWIEEDLQIGCDPCRDGCTDGQVKLGSVRVTINAGNTAFGQSAGYFRIDQAYPSAELSTPAVLKYYTGGLTTNDVTVIRSNGIVSQVIGPQISASVVSNSAYQYQIILYTNSTFTGTAATTWTIQNPDGTSSSNRLFVFEATGGLTNEYDYVWDGTLNGWSLTTQGGAKLELRYNSTNGVLRTETHLILDGSANLKFQETNTYQTFAWGEELIQHADGAGTNALTTTWGFYTNATDTNNYRRLYQVVKPGNNWERYAYDGTGMLSRKVTQYLDAPIPTSSAQENTNRVALYVHYTHTDGFPSQAITNSLNGQQVSWLKRHFVKDQTIETRKQTPDASYNSSYWLNTYTWKNLTPPFVSEPSKILMPDGTMSFYSYELVADGNVRTNTVTTGQPDAGQTQIIDGTRTVTVLDKAGNQISQTKYDVASGLLTYSAITLATDPRGRPTEVQYLDGTTETTVFGCCGVESFTDREGITTAYNYDPYTKQVTDVTRAGVTTHHDHDAAGKLIQTTRIGTNSLTIVQNVSTYDTAGRLTSSTPASNGSGLNQTTSYAEYFDASNHRVNTTTNPDGGTRIENYYQDGSLLSVTGTAVFPLQYSYSLSTASLKYGEVTKEIKLGSGGQTNEWTARYQDSLGRNFLTVYSSASGTPSSQSFYNTKGQVFKQVDPDGATTLYQYDAKGQLAYTATDMNTNGIIDFSGPDRITQTVSDVTTDNGAAVNRVRSFVWNVNNSNTSNLVSTMERSVDGLQSWNIIYNSGVGATNRSQIAYNPAQGSRFVTNVAANGSTTISAYQYGRLISITLKDATGGQIGQAVYGYDAHGRQNTVTDARNGTTTFYFNNADQVAATLTPSPDGVQSGQVTTNFFDAVGRVWKTVLPDNTSVTNVYYTNGLLQRISGSRTYPAQYTYVAQGRMNTMTTWTNYAGAGGAAVTTWNYDGYRGFLTNKVYAGSDGPSYAYTAAGRLASRTWQRTFTIHNKSYNATAWDIDHLKRIGMTGKSPFEGFENVGTGKCKGTVVFEGKCVYAGSLNYIFFGHINSLAHEKFHGKPFKIEMLNLLGLASVPYSVTWSMTDVNLAINYHKNWELKDFSETAAEAFDFASLGYKGYVGFWNQGISLTGGSLKDCDTSKSKPIAESVLHGHWGKITF